MIDENKSVSFVQRNLVKTLMNFGEQERSHLPSMNL